MMKKIGVLVIGAALCWQLTQTSRFYPVFYIPDEAEIEVTSSGLNVRSGPGVNYSVTTEVARGTKLSVLGAIDGWFLVQLENGAIGMVYQDYVKVAAFRQAEVFQGDSEMRPALTKPQGTDQEVLFALANNSRIENGLDVFEWDDNLNRIAQLKADDMVANNYFDHYSPVYGTPFKMLKEMGVDYTGASENLLSNRSMDAAHGVLMGSPAHRGNILSPRFGKMGVGIAESSRYGKIIVQLFLEE